MGTTDGQAWGSALRLARYSDLAWANISNRPDALKNPTALTITVNGSATKYDGSTAQSVNITIPTAIDGATFTPNVSEDGLLSWTNNKSLPNPSPVNIKGRDGGATEAGTGLVKGEDGKTINHKNAVKAGTASGTSGEVSFGGKIKIPTITYDDTGHVTETGSTEITLPTSPSFQAPVTSVSGKTGDVTLEKKDVGLENVENVQQYSVSNPPPYPVMSVNGETGAVEITAESLSLADVATSGDYNDLYNAPDLSQLVQSVNGKTGEVDITADDLGLAYVATTGNYEDLGNTPSIPNVPEWALEETKPAYTKDEVGLGNVENVDTTDASNITKGTLEKDRLSNDVVTSLEKADSALQDVSASGSNGVTASGRENEVTVEGVTATDTDIGVTFLYNAENCTTYDSDDGAATPAAVKQAITETFKASETQFGSVKIYIDDEGYLCIDTE